MRRSLRNTLITASVLGVLGTSPAYADGNGSVSREEAAKDAQATAQLASSYIDKVDSLEQEITDLKQRRDRKNANYVLLGGVTGFVGLGIGYVLSRRRKK